MEECFVAVDTLRVAFQCVQYRFTFQANNTELTLVSEPAKHERTDGWTDRHSFEMPQGRGRTRGDLKCWPLAPPCGKLKEPDPGREPEIRHESLPWTLVLQYTVQRQSVAGSQPQQGARGAAGTNGVGDGCCRTREKAH